MLLVAHRKVAVPKVGLTGLREARPTVPAAVAKAARPVARRVTQPVRRAALGGRAGPPKAVQAREGRVRVVPGEVKQVAANAAAAVEGDRTDVAAAAAAREEAEEPAAAPAAPLPPAAAASSGVTDLRNLRGGQLSAGVKRAADGKMRKVGGAADRHNQLG